MHVKLKLQLWCIMHLTRFRATQMQIILTNFADRFAISQVICDDFSQLWKVPAVPFPAAHNVVVELLIQVV